MTSASAAMTNLRRDEALGDLAIIDVAPAQARVVGQRLELSRLIPRPVPPPRACGIVLAGALS
jgi:hypothetical protein